MALVLALLLCLLLPNAALAARQFNGSSDYLVSASNLTLSGSSKVTLAFWLWWDAYATDDKLAIDYGNGGNGALVLDMNTSSTGKPLFFVSDSGFTPAVSAGFDRPTAAAWHHYVFSIDRSLTGADQITGVWVDGATPAGLTNPHTSDVSSSWGDYALNLMRANGGGSNGAGRMDEVVVYSGYNFVQADVDALYNRGLGADATTVQTPTYYWKIAGAASPEPATSGGISLTVNGTTQVSHLYPTVSGSTVTAASCAQGDVQGAINVAFDGNTVMIPAGTCTWVDTITTSKRLIIQGAGIGQTIVNVGRDPSAPAPQVFIWLPPNTGLSAMSGITWYGYGYNFSLNPNPDHEAGMIRVYADGTMKTLRLHHMEFFVYGTAGMFLYNTMGVVDHSIFHLFAGHGNPGTYYVMPSYHGVGDFGDYSWSQPSSMGTDEAMYFEDNTFLGTPDNNFQFANDGWMGARMVYRHNVYKSTHVGGHGTDSAGRYRGYRHIEVYENTVTIESTSTGLDTWMDARGGTGVFFNNTVTVDPGGFISAVGAISALRAATARKDWAEWGRCLQQDVTLTSSGTTATAVLTTGTDHGFGSGAGVYLTISGASVSGYNGTYAVGTTPDAVTVTFTTSGSGLANATGTIQSPWDGNTETTGYPCLDQAGRGQSDLLTSTLPPLIGEAQWPHQSLEPIYAWGNTKNGVDDPMTVASSGSPTSVVVENRDFYNTTKPGYTPFTYPHPLTVEATTTHKHWIFRHRP